MESGILSVEMSHGQLRNGQKVIMKPWRRSLPHRQPRKFYRHQRV